jgi:hypothetical protein
MIINVYKWQNKYDVIVEDLFIKRLQKNFCKKTMEGFPFPEMIGEIETSDVDWGTKLDKLPETFPKKIKKTVVVHA